MPLTRVYLVLSTADLDALAAGGAVGPAPRPAHAVTAALGRPGLTTDEEELEHTAWLAAADEASGASAGGGARRVIGSADVDAALGGSYELVQLGGGIGDLAGVALDSRVLAGEPTCWGVEARSGSRARHTASPSRWCPV